MEHLKYWAEALAQATILALVLFWVAWPATIDGKSMENTLQTNDHVIMSRYLTHSDNFGVGDILVIEIDGIDGYIVKRLIGVPGDRIVIRDGAVMRNGERINEPYTKLLTGTPGSLDITLGADDFFVLGDNRDVSADSRAFGAIHSANIVGKVIFKYFPEIGLI